MPGQVTYLRIGGTLGWVQGRKPTPQATAMTTLFGESDNKGQAAEDYDASRWPARFQKLNGPASDTDLASFAAMTVTAMRLCTCFTIAELRRNRSVTLPSRDCIREAARVIYL